MIRYRIDKETPEYLTMNRIDLLSLCLHKAEIITFSKELWQEIIIMVNTMYEFEKIAIESHLIDETINTFKIRNESILGKYLIENTDYVEIINENTYINYEDVVAALNIALFDGEDKTSNKIFPLFKEQIFGSKEQLLEKYPEWVLDYILENNDFEKYLAKVNHEELPSETEIKDYIVFEDGVWAIKNLEEVYIHVPKKA